MPTFAHPLALWALLGIPVVLAIHFLQKRSRKVRVTTLFLLQQLQRESEKGNRIERLRLSVPLWLQLLMVLLFTWLLAGPLWLKNDAIHRVALVLDSSASMQAFRPAAEKAVRDSLSGILLPGARAELTLLGTDVNAANLYYGTSAADLVKSMSAWQPQLGTHDFTPALRSARSLVGPQGAVLLITDHPLPAPPAFDAKVLSVGQATSNVGWAGVSVEEKDGQKYWRALVRNYSATPQEREWRAEAAGKASAPSQLILAPNESRTLSGPFLETAEGEMLKLTLTPDALVLDDQLPIVQPQPKTLSLNVPAGKDASAQEIAELFSRFSDTTLEGLSAKADVRIITWPPSIALEANQHACIFASPSRADNAPPLTGRIVGEAHPLTEGLNWQSLLVREGMVMPQDKKDRVLLWQGERPLISLRQTPAGARQLFCHFDLATSNARKLPALAVLLHRFLEEIREGKIAPMSANYDVRQQLTVAHQRGEKASPLTLKTGEGKTETVPVHQAHLLRAPALPTFFEISQGDQTLLTAAAHFADTREADLTQAKPFDESADLDAQQIETLQETDANWRFWILFLLTALLGSWWWGRDKKAGGVNSANPHLTQA
ncbi:aerotolerance regulator-like protein [Prosthecobacter fusiformis]|uniref:Aerotolerance regulator-like protein n=1 Tax=Prosthecobacter fusiformis TaxID=48464 RepID=A0A4R7RTE9_9BACT|nr:VWA domain-containing protein [Prosthecobacter fusiformis]TDU68096.1 aerotolerance regulator-like protein [Prosthecobacter fusiformis]